MNPKVVAELIFLSIFLSSFRCSQGQIDVQLFDQEKDQDVSESPRSSYKTVVDVFQSIYSDCLNEGSFSCVKPKLLSFLSSSVRIGNIQITRDLSILPKEVASQIKAENVSQDNKKEKTADEIILDRLDTFLSTHELKLKFPEELQSFPVLSEHIPKEVKVPLTDTSNEDLEESRGFMKKVALPFVLALKFKISTLVPLALTLIALKAWKALTLGVLSIVLSIVLILFKIAKPKDVNYEVVHYPVVEHYHGHGKSLNGHGLAYRAYR